MLTKWSASSQDGKNLGAVEFGVYMNRKATDAVRLDFNPSGERRVLHIKLLAAALISEYMDMEPSRDVSLAITYAEDSAMRAVKAATVPKKPDPRKNPESEPDEPVDAKCRRSPCGITNCHICRLISAEFGRDSIRSRMLVDYPHNL